MNLKPALFALCLTACTDAAVEELTPAPDLEDMKGDSVDLQGGSTDVGHPAVGLVWMEGGGFCTGTLIASNVVLTAGHCVAGKVEAFYTGTGAPSASFDAPPAGMVRHEVDRQVAFDTATSGCPKSNVDVALLHLSAPAAGIRPIARVKPGTAPAIGKQCVAVGYGAHGTAPADQYMEKRKGTERVDAVLGTTLQVSFVNAVADHGDSGGPLLCNGLIAGTTECHADGDWPTHKVEYYARLDLAAQWITNMIADWR